MGPSGLETFVWDPEELIASKPTLGARGSRLVIHTTIDRRTLPGSGSGNVSVVLELPLKGDAGHVRIAPAGSPSAVEGTWLRGEPPPFVVAPAGLLVFSPTATLLVTAPLVFSWTVVPDQTETGVVWLRGLVVGQSTSCQFTDRSAELQLEQLYPGEPPVIDVDVEAEILSCRSGEHDPARAVEATLRPPAEQRYCRIWPQKPLMQ